MNQTLASSPPSHTVKAIFDPVLPRLLARTTYHSATGLAMLSKTTSCFAS